MSDSSSTVAQVVLTLVLVVAGAAGYLLFSAEIPHLGLWLAVIGAVWFAGLILYNWQRWLMVRKRQALIRHGLDFAGQDHQRLGVLFWVVDRHLNIIEAGGTGLGRHGTSPALMVGLNVRRTPVMQFQVLADLQAAFAGEIVIADYEYDGQIYRSQFFPVANLLRRVASVVCTTVNLSSIHQLDAELSLANAVIDQATDAIVVADHRRRIISVNSAFSAVTGHALADVVGRRLIVPDIASLTFRELRAIARQLRGRGAWEGELAARRKDGSVYTVRLRASLIRERGITTHHLFCFSDISAIKQRQEELHQLANHDVLTGLPNRRLFLDRLDQAIKRSRRQQKPFAVYFVDLDDFKQINDTLGHQAGDGVLIQVARRLSDAVREMDTVARLAGDEFVVLVEQVSGDEEVAEIGRKLLDSFARPFDSGTAPTRTTASIGVAVFPEDGETREILLAVADAAMYKAKEEGRNDFVCHDRAEGKSAPLPPVELSPTFAMEELELHYQPQVDLHNDRIVGCEVLVRWNHAGGRQLLPSQFLPLAESQAMVRPMGYWIAKRAIGQFSLWRGKGLVLDYLSINLASAQLDDDELRALVESEIDLGLIGAGQLRFEVSTGAAVEHPARARAFFLWASELGIGCVLDDFGGQPEGYDLLHSLAVTAVKLNRTLIQESKGNRHAKSVIAAVCALGRVLNFTVVGMGVEQQAQVESLHRSGCQLVQGYYYAPSLSDEDFTRFFCSYHRRAGSY